MKYFKEFVDKKGREAKKQLKLVKQALEKQGMKVSDHRSDDDPYIYLYAPKSDLKFEGIRIYKIGDILSYRIQKEENTHPFGKAYILDVEGIYEDLVSDGIKEKKAAKKVMKEIKEEFINFFKKSQEAEREIRSSEFERNTDPLGQVINHQSGTGTDYAQKVHSSS